MTVTLVDKLVGNTFNFAKGDGSTTAFDLRRLGLHLAGSSSIYQKTDWQGIYPLSSSARTNNWLQNTALGTAPNVPAQASVTAAAGIAPDGTNTAWKLAEDATINVHVLLQSITYGATDVSQTFYVKAAERTKCAVTTDQASGFLVHVDLAAGVITSISGSGTGTIKDLGNGWYKVTATSTVTAGAKSARVYIATVANSVASYQGVLGRGILVWHPQSQLASEITSDISPVGATPLAVTDYSIAGSTITLASALPVGGYLGRKLFDQYGKVI